ncbi:hypothetical protein IV56_GL001935 [Lacticaseibacillus saniviri JCM 17471 = DSM 24301]|uniref:Uncharacterized protein n=1 Tax=Lacticaseibacillus saniviri JCM 17471 = DSM 24301 TaxID=1293598 RepID=A0A0R2MRC1_9LACO|nr:hypothetical protein IV56_GL001935 [Lacticaseibacillus saniviri JCM 17471 = DSM 24301]
MFEVLLLIILLLGLTLIISRIAVPGWAKAAVICVSAILIVLLLISVLVKKSN